MIILYGIPNCDSTRKAEKWLQAHAITYRLHNYKEQGITSQKLKQWCSKAGWQIIFNKRSSTWKQVMKAYEGLVNNQAEAIQIMQQHHSIIKRPIIEAGEQLIVGFDEKQYQQLVKQHL